MIDTVMGQYLSMRKNLSATEESLNKPKEALPPTGEQVLSMKREVVEMKYQNFLNGNSSFAMQPPDGIATLALDGYCEFDVYEDFLGRALEITKSKMKSDAEAASMAFKGALAEKLNAEMELLTSDDERVVLLAKKIALIYCFMKFKEAGFQNIYTSE